MDEVERELLWPNESSIVFHKYSVLGNTSEDTFIRSNYVEMSFFDLYNKNLLEKNFDSKEPVSSLIVKIHKSLNLDEEAESLNDKFKSMSLWKWIHRLLGCSFVNLRQVVFIGVTELTYKAQKLLMKVISMESSLQELAVSAEFFESKKDLCMFGTVLGKFEGESVEVSFYHDYNNGELGVFSSALHCSESIPKVLMIELGNIYAVEWKFKREKENVKILSSLALCQGCSLTLNSVIMLDDFEEVFEMFDNLRLPR